MAFDLVERDGIRCWQLAKWKTAGIEHGFLGASLDIRQKDAQQRFQSLYLQADQPLLMANQVHGDQIIEIDRIPEPEESFDADALVLDVSAKIGKLSLGVYTADCYPILFVDPTSGAIATAHCGWRGTAANLLPKVISKMAEQVERLEDIEIAIGPGASAASYEVDELVAGPIQQNLAMGGYPEKTAAPVLEASRPGHFLCNLRQLLRLQAVASGVLEEKIYCHPACTIKDVNFFSYRRQKPLSSRQLSYICSLR